MSIYGIICFAPFISWPCWLCNIFLVSVVPIKNVEPGGEILWICKAIELLSEMFSFVPFSRAAVYPYVIIEGSLCTWHLPWKLVILGGFQSNTTLAQFLILHCRASSNLCTSWEGRQNTILAIRWFHLDLSCDFCNFSFLSFKCEHVHSAVVFMLAVCSHAACCSTHLSPCFHRLRLSTLQLGMCLLEMALFCNFLPFECFRKLSLQLAGI